MRNLNLLAIYRVTAPPHLRPIERAAPHKIGTFIVPSEVDSGQLGIIATATGGWDHVSVSRQKRCPTWAEMEQVKRLFFSEDETAMQLHVPPADHISRHPYCLHLWRPQGVEIPRPPAEMV